MGELQYLPRICDLELQKALNTDGFDRRPIKIPLKWYGGEM
jgi:hypothetical protein